ncbi:hypothetical protein GUJ93_ZPchr0013g36659 [Zizania palustris]|uniref:Uncharacterized protein n=1 Tax=Zizania palustris TaxID=103762 RepID=A0A8J5WS73_ZIZPA|nr:hypothetical protein GUJ93_ZPchr0013g36659 [Zizania palustris]
MVWGLWWSPSWGWRLSTPVALQLCIGQYTRLGYDKALGGAPSEAIVRMRHTPSGHRVGLSRALGGWWPRRRAGGWEGMPVAEEAVADG